MKMSMIYTAPRKTIITNTMLKNKITIFVIIETYYSFYNIQK